MGHVEPIVERASWRNWRGSFNKWLRALERGGLIVVILAALVVLQNLQSFQEIAANLLDFRPLTATALAERASPVSPFALPSGLAALILAFCLGLCYLALQTVDVNGNPREPSPADQLIAALIAIVALAQVSFTIQIAADVAGIAGSDAMTTRDVAVLGLYILGICVVCALLRIYSIRQSAPWAGRILQVAQFAALAAALVLVANHVNLISAANPLEVTAWLVISALLPYAPVLILQRPLGTRVSAHRPPSQSAQIHLLIVGVVVIALTCFFFIWMTPGRAGGYGSLFVAYVWVAWLCAACTLVAIMRRAYRFPGILLFAAGAICFATVYFLPERTGAETLQTVRIDPEPQRDGTLGQASARNRYAAIRGRELQSLVDLMPGMSSQLIVSADGGGLRAAAFTASVLAFADDFTCGAFGDRVRAVSGASGGSLGLATWLLAREAYLQKELIPWKACLQEIEGVLFDSRAPLPRAIESPLADHVIAILGRDHLAGTLFTGLTMDIRPVARQFRGQQLVDSWQKAFKDAFESKSVDVASPPGKVTVDFASAIGEVSGGIEPPPYVMINATDPDTGRAVIQSSLADNPQSRLPIGIAVLNSARFPFISPVGIVDPNGQRTRVVDGGFFDNTGAIVLGDQLRSRSKQLFQLPKYVRINGSIPDSGTFCKRITERADRVFSESSMAGIAEPVAPEFRGWAPSTALATTRTARDGFVAKALHELYQGSSDRMQGFAGELSLDPMQNVGNQCLNSDNDFSDRESLACLVRSLDLCRLQDPVRKIPLTWHLSLRSAHLIKEQAAETARRLLNAGSAQPLTEFDWANFGRFGVQTARTETLQRYIDSFKPLAEAHRDSGQDPDRAAKLNNLANAYSLVAEGKVGDAATLKLQEAEATYAKALKWLPPGSEYDSFRATVYANLGHAQAAWSRQDSARAGEAVNSLRIATKLKPGDPRYHYMFGQVLVQHGEDTNDLSTIEEGIAAFDVSERHWRTTGSEPLWLAAVRHDKGIALTTLSRYYDDVEQGPHLQRAARSFERALEGRSRKDTPLDWADTHRRLGQVFVRMSALDDQVSNLKAGLCEYRAALQERRSDSSLFVESGSAWQKLWEATGDPRFASQAEAAYTSALLWPHGQSAHEARTQLVRLEQQIEEIGQRLDQRAAAPEICGATTLHAGA
jgi:tetratricopeptide (TPR) repeat protein